MFSALLSLAAHFSFAQDAIFSQFYAASLYLNPAFAGTSDGSTRITLNYRNNPLPDARGFSAMFASVDAFVPAIYGGIGVVAVSDNQGDLFTNNHISAVYSYHLRLDRELYMNFGAQAGYYRQELNWNRLEFNDPGQQPPEQLLREDVDFSAGLLVYNENFYGGISAHHLNQPKTSAFGDERLPLKLTGHLGMTIEPASRRRAGTLMFDYIVSPNIIYQQQGGFRRVNLGLYAGIESFIAGVWLRHDLDNPSAMIFLAGVRMNNYTIGYSYDHSLSGFTDLFHTSHEISVRFDLYTSRQRFRARPLRCPGI